MSVRVIDASRQNLSFAFRQLVTQRTFTVIAVLTLALGIGFTTAIFSVVHAVVLRPLPVPGADRLVVVNEVWRERPGNVSAGNFVDWRAAAKSFESLAAAQYSSFNLADAGTAERVIGARVTAAYFEVFGTPPVHGRVFTAAEDEPGREQLVWMLAVLGAVGLVLAAIGIYGVIAYFVGQRSQEIGVRMALGASARDVVTLVVRQAIGPVLIGVAAGGAAALALRDVMNAQLYGVSPRDPVTLVLVMLVLITVALMASIIPARRAVRIDPARALRSQ